MGTRLTWELVNWLAKQIDRLVVCCGFLPKGLSEQTIIVHLCGSGKYALVLRFNIRRGEPRVPAPSET